MVQDNTIVQAAFHANMELHVFTNCIHCILLNYISIYFNVYCADTLSSMFKINFMGE
jgi:hypothetical protein